MTGPKWIVENTWTCSTCATVNPGAAMRCAGCGKPKTESEQYDTSGATAAAAVTDAQKLAQAAAGIHWVCTFCGNEERALGDRCGKCGAARADAARAPTGPAPALGAPVGLPQPVVTQVPIPKKRSPLVAIGCVGALGLCCVFGAFAFWPRTSDARVESLHWESTANLQSRTVQTGQGFRSAIPATARVGACDQRANGTENCNPYACTQTQNQPCNPHPCNCHRVCRDLQNGYSECSDVCDTCTDQCPTQVATTCYQQCPKYEAYCTYETDVWQTVSTRTTQGDTPAVAPPGELVAAGPDQRVERVDVFTVRFAVGNDRVEHHPATLAEFQQFVPGAAWEVQRTLAGGFTPLHPK